MRTAAALASTALYTIAAACALALATPAKASAQNVTVTLPTTNTFNVRNVQLSTGATRTTITWSSTGSFSGNHFRISVKADTANFTAPAAGRTAIPATNVSWTIVSATNGTGINGTMSSSGYTVLYNAGNGKKSGTVVVDWNLAAPGTNHRSGNHQLSLHWRLDAVP